MRIIGLDLASTAMTGWSLLEASAPSKESIQLLQYGTLEPFDDMAEAEKYFLISQQIETLLRLFRPDNLVIEDTFFSKNVTVLKKLNRLAGHVQASWYKLHHSEAYFYMATSTRKSLDGLSGKATKEEIVAAVNKFFGLRGKLTDHNAADAIVTAYHFAMTDAFKKPDDLPKETPDVIVEKPPVVKDFAKPIPKENHK